MPGLPKPRRTPLHVLRWVLPLALLVAGGVHGSLRSPSGPASGQGLTGPVSAAMGGPVFRVATFNIHGGRGADRRRDLGRTAAALRNADLAGLNEVRAELPWEGPGQAARLGAALEMASLFAPTERRWWRDDFGNALLSRLPVEAWERSPLPGRGRPPFRSTLTATVRLPGGSLRVLVTHVNPRREGDGALEEVTRRFLALEPPAVLLGDLNTEESDPRLRPLLRAPGVRDPVREVLGTRRPRRIDWILTRGLTIADAGMVDNGASDHPCVRAELRLPTARRLKLRATGSTKPASAD